MGLHILYESETNEYVARLLAASLPVSLVGKARRKLLGIKKQKRSRRLQGGEKKAVHEMHMYMIGKVAGA